MVRTLPVDGARERTVLYLVRFARRPVSRNVFLRYAILNIQHLRRGRRRMHRKGLPLLIQGRDIEWLKSHPEMLFPKDAKTAATWFKIVQHRAQESISGKTTWI